jgi:PAS domain-containing protein
MTPESAEVARVALASSGALPRGGTHEHQPSAEIAEHFGVRSDMLMALRPKGDRPYLFGLHQCSRVRTWTKEEQRLFEEVGHRLTDALGSLIAFRGLRESERRLEEAQRVAHLGYWDRDLVANRVVLAEESWRIFGVEPHERPADLAEWNKRWHAFIDPDDRPRVLAAVQAALAGGPRYDVEFRITRKNGEVRVIHSQGDVIRDASGRAIRMFGTQQDITELRQAEKDLRASETRFRALVDHATDGFFLHADDSTVIDVNQQAMPGLNYSREALGMHSAQVRRGPRPAVSRPDYGAHRQGRGGEFRDAAPAQGRECVPGRGPCAPVPAWREAVARIPGARHQRAQTRRSGASGAAGIARPRPKGGTRGGIRLVHRRA